MCWNKRTAVGFMLLLLVPLPIFRLLFLGVWGLGLGYRVGVKVVVSKKVRVRVMWLELCG